MSANTSQLVGRLISTAVALLVAAALVAAVWLGGLNIAAAHDGLHPVWRDIVALLTWNRAATVGVVALTAITFLALYIRQGKSGRQEDR